MSYYRSLLKTIKTRRNARNSDVKMSASRLAVREQDLRVIRPLVYVREKALIFTLLLRAFLRALKVLSSKCRVSVKTLAACALRLVEEQPQLYERLVGGRKEGADEVEDSLQSGNFWKRNNY